MKDGWLTPFSAWLEKEKKYSQNTIISYRTDIDQFIDFINVSYEEASLLTVGRREISAWMMEMLKKGISPRSINRKITSLNRYYFFGLKHDLVSKNPVEGVTKLKTSKRLASFIDETTISKIFAELDISSDFAALRSRLIVELFYQTGIRISELIGLTHSDIDSSRNQIKVLGKGGKERNIPIDSKLINLIEQYNKAKSQNVSSNMNGEDSLFITDTGRSLYPMFISRLMNQMLGGYANVTKTNPHLLRHTFATHLLNNGGDINAIKELLGHSSLAATSVYTHNSIERLKDVHKSAHPRK